MRRGRPFWPCDIDRGRGKMIKTVGVVEVEMGEDDGGDAVYGEVERCQLTVDLLVAGDREFELGAYKPTGKAAGGFEPCRVGGFRAFASVDDEGAFGVLDDHYPDGQPVGETAVEDAVDKGEGAFETGVHEPVFVLALTGGEQVDADGATRGGKMDGSGGEHQAKFVELR